MSGTIVRIDELGDAIRNEIESMNKDVIEQVNKAADKASKQGARDLKAASPVRTDGYNRKVLPGSYAKSWGVVKEGNVLGVTQYTIRNAKYGALTHLLEFGHILRDSGGRVYGEVGPKPHIADVNKSVNEQFIREVEGMKL